MKLTVPAVIAAAALTLAGCAAPGPPAAGRHGASPSTGMEFVWIPEMEMWVGKYEVTNEEYRRKVPGHDSGMQGDLPLNKDRQPVVRVSFEDAKKYAEWMTEQDKDHLPAGCRYRLPGEEEWERFARCGDGRKYPWGDSYPPRSGRAGNYADEDFRSHQDLPSLFAISGYHDGHVVSAPVDELWRNPWGLYGVGGNVWEACASDAGGESFGAWRGGSSGSTGESILRCSYRSRMGGAHTGVDYGFRLVLGR